MKKIITVTCIATVFLYAYLVYNKRHTNHDVIKVTTPTQDATSIDKSSKLDREVVVDPLLQETIIAELASDWINKKNTEKISEVIKNNKFNDIYRLTILNEIVGKLYTDGKAEDVLSFISTIENGKDRDNCLRRLSSVIANNNLGDYEQYIDLMPFGKNRKWFIADYHFAMSLTNKDYKSVIASLLRYENDQRKEAMPAIRGEFKKSIKSGTHNIQEYRSFVSELLQAGKITEGEYDFLQIENE